MQLLLFTVLIFSNVLFIQGQLPPASSPARSGKGYNIDELYQKYSIKTKSMRSECQTEQCKLDVLIKQFSAESETAPPITPPSRPSLFGDILQFLVKKKTDLIGNVIGNVIG